MLNSRWCLTYSKFPGGTNQSKSGGFSLLEILIAIVITAFVSVSAFGVLNEALKTQQSAETSDQRLAEIQRAMNRVTTDFQQFALRSVRDAYGDSKPALTGEKSADASYVSFTRQGKRNPAKLPRTELERITYRFNGESLIRDQWLVLDIASEDQIVEREILTDVLRFEVEFYKEEQWQESWALDSFDKELLLEVPDAVKIVIELRDHGEIKQIFPLGLSK